MEPKKDNLLSCKYVVWDTETAPIKHLHPMPTEVIEIGWVVLQQGVITSQSSTLVKPMFQIPTYVSEALGITNEMVNESPDITDAIAPMIVDLQGAVSVGHNLKYDISVVKESLSRRLVDANIFNSITNIPTVDTLSFFSKLFPGERRRLKDMIRVLGIKEDVKRHRAGADSYYTALSLIKLLKLFNENYGIDNIRALIQYTQTGNPYIQESLF